MSKVIAAVGLLLSTALPAVAAEPDAMLYELTEDMSIKHGHRRATSALGGFAVPGTPLCPERLTSTSGVCVVNATGSNNIDLSTGRGPIDGEFTNVTQDTNPIDIEEVVRRRGSFRGQMDLSQGSVTFLGSMAGRMTVHGERGKDRFRGVVRFPIPCDQGFCYVASGPDALPTGLVEPLLSHEYALGHPMVRLDIFFE